MNNRDWTRWNKERAMEKTKQFVFAHYSQEQLDWWFRHEAPFPTAACSGRYQPVVNERMSLLQRAQAAMTRFVNMLEREAACNTLRRRPLRQACRAGLI